MRWLSAVQRVGSGLRGCWRHGGVLEGGVAAAMVAGTSALAGLPASGPLLVLAFCGTLLVYHLDRTPALSPEDRTGHPARWRWRHRHGALAAGLAAGAGLGAAWALPHLRAATLLAGAVLAVPAAAYALPFFGEGEEPRASRRLKDVGAAKPFAVAAAWAVASVALPALEAGAALAPALAFWAGYRFLFVLPNVLLADAADGGLRHHALWTPQRLHRWAAGALAAALAAGAVALFFAGAPLLLAIDLGGPALLLVVVCTRPPGLRLARAADALMLWPAVTALACMLMR